MAHGPPTVHAMAVNPFLSPTMVKDPFLYLAFPSSKYLISL